MKALRLAARGLLRAEISRFELTEATVAYAQLEMGAIEGRAVVVPHTKVRKVPKAAGTRGRHLLRRLGFTLVRRPEPFLVEDTKGPLIDGEVERASEWGRELARDVAQRLSVGAADDLGRR